MPLRDPVPPNYYVSLISDRWLKAETRLPISFKHLLLPSKFPPPTELLDLQPLSVSALLQPEYIEYLRSKDISLLNPIQTQTFTALFSTSNNVFIGAPSGSGKTLCAELALFRFWMQETGEKAVYIIPVEEVIEERYLYWSAHFKGLVKYLQNQYSLAKKWVKLTGESTLDLKLMEQGDVILATPTHWDRMSRRWKQRKNVRNVGLCIVDEAHMLGDAQGPTLEIVISRMRYMSKQLEKDIRMVVLSASLGNARDLGEWIGCTPENIFNFHPNVRPVPLEIHIQSFNIPHFASLLLAMTKPAALAIERYCSQRQAIVFVPSRQHCRLIAQELVQVSVFN